ncbi:MAG: hydrogenase maturation protease [Flavobacteriaceae bacterium]|nr:hydrogenase maturation protease [Flavobacteriaceae bacterium]
MSEINKTLLFGIGNCGRADDGLGWAFLDKIKPHLPDNYDVEYRYQLQVEDAELATQYQTVIFIDAHKNIFEKGFVWEACFSKATDSFSTHELDPGTILYLAKSIYNKQPQASILGISGENFQLQIGLSKIAQENLINALEFFNEKISSNHIKEAT